MKRTNICLTCRMHNPEAEKVFGIPQVCRECVLPQLEEQAEALNIVFDSSMTEESMEKIIAGLKNMHKKEETCRAPLRFGAPKNK